jgi:outer membrane biosynthesis protein TonB
LKEDPTYPYSADDIQRYIDGKMTAGEMHAIEKAALEDPFLADAIEGIREMHPNLKTDLMEIKNKLSEQPERKPVKVSWLAILAAAIIVISLSFGGWLFFKEDDAPQIAKLEEPTPAPNTEMTPDTAASAAATTPDSQAVQAEEMPTTKKTVPASGKMASESTPTRAKPVTAPSAAPAPPASAEVQLMKSEPTADKKRMAAAPISEPAQSQSVPTKEAAASKAQTNDYPNLEMAKNVEPVNGWSAFAKYIAGNMQRPAGENAGLHGKVPMTFIVDPDGSISNIKVERSLHPEYDKEAVRLLSNGPKWKASNSDKPVRAVYTIVF